MVYPSTWRQENVDKGGTETWNHLAAPGMRWRLGGTGPGTISGNLSRASPIPPLPTGEAEADHAADRGGED